MQKKVLIYAVLVASLILAGCGTPKYNGPLRPVPTQVKIPGYTATDTMVEYVNKAMVMSVKPVFIPRVPSQRFLNLLIASQYMAFELSIHNPHGEDNIIFDPIHTALIYGKISLVKPMEYTALYQMAVGLDDRSMEESLRDQLNKKFYDLTTTIGPGETVTKFLILPPIDPTTKKALLSMKLIHVGNELVSIQFPFDFVPIDKLDGTTR